VTLRLQSQTQLPAATKDGTSIEILGNIEFPEEVEQCLKYGANGIGLYRTEFLYLGKEKEPTEEDHYEAYCKVLAPLPGRAVVVRTQDLGADKLPENMSYLAVGMDNPFLGLRSLRLSLHHLPLFKTQLRAILRAAVHGDIRLMFPLVTTMYELRQAKMVLSDVMEDLEYQGIPFKRDIPVGMMVEVPSAALMAEEFAREVDFFSIGTNDLIQYTLAVDRANTQVANLFSSGDPSVLRLIEQVVRAGQKAGIPVTVCGQMSSDPAYTALLLGLGVRQISVTPHSVPELKEVIRHLSIGQAEEIAAHARSLDVARDVESYVRGELKKLLPELYN
ncbi:MAG: phosphoenolpyruvate--protein phosphotransferase, partial [Planctomycetales bacterium]